MKSSAVISRGSLPLSAAVDSDIVMFHPNRGSYFVVSEVGARVWELVEQPMSFEELCETLSAEYDVEANRCRAEVEAFVSQLHEAGLVDVSD